MNRPAYINRAILVALFALAMTIPALFMPARAAPPDPIRRGRIFDLPVTGAAAIFSSALTTKSNLTSGAYRITIGLSGTNSVVNVQVIQASPAKTYTLALNGGTTCTAGNLYTFTTGVDGFCSYNLTCTTSTTIAVLIVDEVISDGL